MSLRNILEKLSRGIILKRRMPNDLGGRAIFVSPEGGLRYWKPRLKSIDPMLSQVVQQFINKGDIIWDIGTNLGFFSLASISKSKTGSCLSIEPDIWLCNILERTKRLNNDLNIDILPIAVSDEIGISKFIIANRARTTNHLYDVKGSTQTGGVRQIKYVPTFTLNYLLELYAPPDFLKIDTEGAEWLVLKGASKVLAHKPKILIEVFQDSFTEVKNILTNFDYKLYNADYLPTLKEIDSSPCENILALYNP